MVPREQRAEPPRHARRAGIFGDSNKPVAVALRATVVRAKQLGHAAGDVLNLAPASLRAQSTTYAGIACVACGALARVAFAAPGGRVLAIAGSASALLWAAIRLAALALLVRDLRRDDAAVRGAWGVGLAAWAIAWSPILAAIAWAASGFVTLAALEQLGERKPSARRAVAIAWGAQAAFVTAVWLARNAWVALLASS